MFADFQTHLTWLRKFALQHATTRLPFGGVIAVNLAVEAGLMAGTSTRLRAESLLIGSGPDCDVQLFDEGVADQHVEIRLRSSIFGTLAEVTAQDTAEIEGEAPLSPGAGPRLLLLPLVVSIGPARLRLTSQGAVGMARKLNRRNFALSGLIAVLAIGIFLSVNQAVRSAQIESVALTVAQAPVEKPQLRVDGPDLSKAKLTDLDLAEDVILHSGEGGSLFAAGTVPTGQWDDWQSFRAWYDQQPGMPTLVSAVTMAPKLIELRQISSVRLHKPETVFFATGQPAKIGDVIEEGWTLTAIDADGLTLKRSNEITRIRF